MKRYFYIALSALVLWACGKDDPTPTPSPTPKAPTAIRLSSASFSMGKDGGSQSLTVTSPFKPSLSGVPAWMSVKEGTFDSVKYTISYELTVSANETYEERTATVTLKATGVSDASFTVKQEAAEKPEEPEGLDETLTNAKASATAQKVYSFLLEQNGKKILSGVQSGGTANNNERVNQLYKLTGKHPALAGYDYIFLQYSPTPEVWSWVVNYADISAAKEQWKNNGLVSFMWHWNVPSTEADWEKGKNGNFEGYDFYSDKTSFSITRALADGTWENKFLLQDIEKVAGYLKLLQAEGIPVLWRPLHEAAGNYNLYGITNNAWFWWGRGGADACKKLWKLLRDKLEGEYGLDNLIWVWTLDVTPGAEKDYASWYPGNDLVDIVGVDIYADDTDAKARQYKAAVDLSGGHKMVTVSECGNIPDPAKCFAAGETWSWFLTWDLEGFSLNTDSYWKQLMASSRVLTRESMPSLK